MLVWRRGLLAAAFMTLATGSSVAAEKVGEAVLIKTSVTGASGSLATNSPVHRDERIRTSGTGLGEFVFRDGTKFAIGRNSSVVIDQFVFNDSKSVKNLTIRAAKGSFRWISGGSNSSAYKINTPAGTIGIRGTALDVFVDGNGTTAVVLLNGRARFCGSNGCRELRRRCDVVVATPGRGVQNPKRLDRGVLNQIGAQRALPFITGQQKLSGKFRVPGNCLSVPQATPTAPQQKASVETSPPAPSPPEEPPAPPEEPPSEPKGNNGKGNGGGDGSPNDKDDTNG